MPSRPATPQSTFDSVAGRYDLVNTVLSLGQDRKWRRAAARRLTLAAGSKVLDVGTGTGSLALTLGQELPPGCSIVGCDINRRMLEVARRRLVGRNVLSRVELVEADGTALPFGDACFDAVTIAFALDDMRTPAGCAREMSRVLKPGGQLVLLELSLPEDRTLLRLYRSYLRIFDVVAPLISRRPSSDHLREEVLRYRGAERTASLLRGAGLDTRGREPLFGGVVTLHDAVKPGSGR
jgi:demethylmenaquinone methyltransferase/2-methoxy-6-polyprenyl-1,4-benzoquinol methylase